MKIIHTSDWHLGQEFFHYDRKEEYLYFFRQLCELVQNEQPDVLVVCGDIYHTATPSNATTKLYTEQMVMLHESCPSMETVVIAGNHDSCSRLESTGEVWRLAKVTVVGGIERDEVSNNILLDRHIVEISNKGFVIAVPFISEKNYSIFQELQQEVSRRNTKGLPVVMMGHLAVSGADFTGHDQPIGGIVSEPIENLGNGYDYFALGHIHRPQTLTSKKHYARYSGSPIQVNFDEKYPHSVTVVEIEKYGSAVKFRDVEIIPLKKFYDIPNAPLPFEEALKALQNLDVTSSGYVRLNVVVKDYAPSNSEFRIHECMKSKKDLHFCYLNVIREENSLMKENQMFNTQEIKEINPLTLAEVYYQEKFGTTLDDTTKHLLSEVIEAVKREDE